MDLVRRGHLASAERDDRQAVVDALYKFFDATLGPCRIDGYAMSWPFSASAFLIAAAGPV